MHCLLSRNFEALANGILECCWAKDRQYTSDMLVREAPSWGHTTVLSMAYHAEMEEFLAQPACYTKLTKLWRGDIALRTHPGWVWQNFHGFILFYQITLLVSNINSDADLLVLWWEINQYRVCLLEYLTTACFAQLSDKIMWLITINEIFSEIRIRWVTIIITIIFQLSFNISQLQFRFPIWFYHYNCH